MPTGGVSWTSRSDYLVVKNVDPSESDSELAKKPECNLYRELPFALAVPTALMLGTK